MIACEKFWVRWCCFRPNYVAITLRVVGASQYGASVACISSAPSQRIAACGGGARRCCATSDPSSLGKNFPCQVVLVYCAVNVLELVSGPSIIVQLASLRTILDQSRCSRLVCVECIDETHSCPAKQDMVDLHTPPWV